MIQVTGLSKNYGPHKAIDNLNFEIKKGEVVGFLGPNGAGKSTTMKIITGFMSPTSGVAKVAGFDVFENPLDVKKRIGYLPEVPPVYTDMLVKDYLSYVADLKGVPKENKKALVARAIEKTQLEEVQNRLIHNLSKGFKQRVGIAQALVSDPEVLILDEPTVGLDPKQVSEIRDLIKELRGQHTIILSTHILSEVQATCERIIIINRGQIVAQETLANLSNLQKGQRKIHLKIRNKVSDLKNALGSIAGITEINAGATPQDWLIQTVDQEELVEQIASSIIAKGLGLLEIRSDRADLEDIFLKLTYGQEATNG